MWAVFVCLRIAASWGCFEHDNGPADSIKFRKYFTNKVTFIFFKMNCTIREVRNETLGFVKFRESLD